MSLSTRTTLCKNFAPFGYGLNPSHTSGQAAIPHFLRGRIVMEFAISISVINTNQKYFAIRKPPICRYLNACRVL